jgi:hypothetical protein
LRGSVRLIFRVLVRVAALGRFAIVADAQRGPPLVEEGDALLDALEGPDDVAFEADEHGCGVFVRPAPDFVAIGLGGRHDLAALVLGLLGQATLIDEERRLLLGRGDDPLGLLLGLLDDPLALGIDPLGGPDFLGDGDAQLVDEVERGYLVDDDVARQGQLLAVRDDRFEALDEEDDVDLGILLARAPDPFRRLWHGMTGGHTGPAPLPRRSSPGALHGVTRRAARTIPVRRSQAIVGHPFDAPAGIRTG